MLVETAPHDIELYHQYHTSVVRLKQWTCSIFSNESALAWLHSGCMLFSRPQIGMRMPPYPDATMKAMLLPRVSGHRASRPCCKHTYHASSR